MRKNSPRGLPQGNVSHEHLVYLKHRGQVHSTCCHAVHYRRFQQRHGGDTGSLQHCRFAYGDEKRPAELLWSRTRLFSVCGWSTEAVSPWAQWCRAPGAALKGSAGSPSAPPHPVCCDALGAAPPRAAVPSCWRGRRGLWQLCDTTGKEKSFILNNHPLPFWLERTEWQITKWLRLEECYSCADAEVTRIPNETLKLSEQQPHAQLNLLRGASWHNPSSSRGPRRIHARILFCKSITLQ